MRKLTRGVAKYVLYPIARTFAVYGQYCAPICPFPQAGAMGITEQLYPAPERRRNAPQGSPGQLVGPYPGHPEQLRPDLRLSDFEREVLRQLDLDSVTDSVTWAD
jgi:hypothetical protein